MPTELNIKSIEHLSETKPAWLPLPLFIDCDLQNEIKSELTNLDSKYWFDDSYRGCTMTMLFSDGGEFKDKKSIHNAKGKEMQWTEVSSFTPLLKKFIIESIFPHLSVYGRVTILRSLPNSSMKEHFDCSSGEEAEYMPKFRYVLGGPIDSLYFCDGDDGKKHIPSFSRAYIIDGSRAHGMDIGSDDTKYTLCLGAPWNGEVSLSGFELVSQALNSQKAAPFYRKNIQAPNRVIEHQDFKKYEY